MDNLTPQYEQLHRQEHWDGFKTHLRLAFREFDVNYYETYIFSVVISFTALWAIATLLQYLFCRKKSDSKGNKALTLLKDDLHKSGPYKRDRSGMPIEESVIKMHAVIFKHAQKKIIEKELYYQEKRIQYLKDKNMTQYKNLVRKASIEYGQIEEYVADKACGLMKIDKVIYTYAFTRALQKPSMLSKIKGSDESFRRRMWKRVSTQTDKVDTMSEQ